MSKPKERTKQISAIKITANHQNAQKSTGPRDTSSTRYNALKHGLLAEGVTEIDNPAAFAELCARLNEEHKPVGEVEAYLVRRIALCLVRVRRAPMLEAEFITEKLNPPVIETTYPFGGDMTEGMEHLYGRKTMIDPGLPASLSVSNVEELLKFQRYEGSNPSLTATPFLIVALQLLS